MIYLVDIDDSGELRLPPLACAELRLTPGDLAMLRVHPDGRIDVERATGDELGALARQIDREDARCGTRRFSLVKRSSRRF